MTQGTERILTAVSDGHKSLDHMHRKLDLISQQLSQPQSQKVNAESSLNLLQLCDDDDPETLILSAVAGLKKSLTQIGNTDFAHLDGEIIHRFDARVFIESDNAVGSWL